MLDEHANRIRAIRFVGIIVIEMWDLCSGSPLKMNWRCFMCFLFRTRPSKMNATVVKMLII